MKSKLLTFAFLIASTAGFAQIPGGTWFASGGICFDNSKSVNPTFNGTDYTDLEDSFTRFQLKLGAGYAFTENQAIGLGFGLDNSKSTNQSFTGQPSTVIETRIDKDNDFFIAPFYRYYYFCAPQFAIIGQVHIPIVFTGGEQSFEYDDGSSTIVNEQPNGIGIGGWVTPSFAWFPKSTWSLEASIGQLGFYTEGYNDDNDNRYSTSDFSAKLWLFQPTLSFTYYFGGIDNNNVQP